ncbi:MAG TPA: GAF domain-containing protein [Kofleriaceae bacterium]|nr:GAF domain-containing protein [Kofleriaceae bacterium]
MGGRARSIIHVHHRGDRGVDGILRLIELASHDGPLEAMLTAMCDEIASIAGVEIASVYVAEDERLVMRGNHGFDESAIGSVSLGVGEGITGLVAECMRPVSAAHAATEAAYKHVPGLGEERFPVFAGIPLITGGAVVGVLVMQRRKKPFALDEVTLATALAAPITLAIERRKATAVRSARLTGVGHGGAVVLGRAGIVPTATAIGTAPFASLIAPHGPASPSDSSDDIRDGDNPIAAVIDRVLARIRDDLGRAMKKLGDIEDPVIGACLDRYALALVDGRLRERIIAAAQEPSGLRSVAKDYARAATRIASRRPPTTPPSSLSQDSRPPELDAETAERVAEIEELCALIGLTADARSSARPGASWIADRVGPVITVAAIARGAAAVVASDRVTPTALAIAAAAKLPVVSGVAGLFGWARPGDLLAVDGESGTVLVHPAPTEIERLRRERSPS